MQQLNPYPGGCMEGSVLSLVLLLFAGIAAGFLNVLAGGGSLLTLPILIFLGLPPVTANGTNRVAILCQNVVAVHKFRKTGFFMLKEGIILGLTASVGAAVGSMIAVETSGELFRRILSVVMIIVLALILLGNKTNPGQEKVQNIRLLVPLFFLVGIYGGFIQAGVGFIIIAIVTTVGGAGLIQTNALKVLVIMIYMIPSLIVFLVQGHVNWTAGLVLAAGTTTGAWLGARFSVLKGDKWIRYILTAAVVSMAVKLFFF